MSPNETNILRPHNGVRLLAKLIDVLAVALLVYGGAFILPDLQTALVLFAWPAYNQVTVWKFGASPGKRLLGLRVTDGQDRPCGPWRALCRTCLEYCYFIPLVGLIALVALLVSKDGRSPLDHTVKTRVLRQ
jgi:uncharacterized RDD family membrane protein YckC